MSWATSLVPACQSLAALLTQAGVPASLNRADVRVPGAWFAPETAGQVTLSGAGRARVAVYLVTQPAGDLEVLKDLTAQLEAALTVIDPDEDVDTSVVINIRRNTVPAFRLLVDLDLEE